MTLLPRTKMIGVLALVATPGLLGAQRAPQAAARDTTPTVRLPVQPGLRPSQTTPRGRAATAIAAERAAADAKADAEARAPRVIGVLPIDSVRPKPPVKHEPSARELPPTFAPPPAPVARPVERATVSTLRADDTPPANATGRCKDGTFLTSTPTESSCADHQGLAVTFLPRPTPPPPRRP